jgi:hypothetical protein
MQTRTEHSREVRVRVVSASPLRIPIRFSHLCRHVIQVQLIHNSNHAKVFASTVDNLILHKVGPQFFYAIRGVMQNEISRLSHLRLNVTPSWHIHVTLLVVEALFALLQFWSLQHFYFRNWKCIKSIIITVALALVAIVDKVPNHLNTFQAMRFRNT